MASEGFQGPVRVIGSDGILLTTGMATLEPDPAMGSWRGRLVTFNGTGVAGKALVVELEIPGNGKGRAQLTPHSIEGDRAISAVVGYEDPFF
jgi:hypothetical protein